MTRPINEISELPKIKKKNKYGAQACYVDDFRFDSKKEADFYIGLKAQIGHMGRVSHFLRQVPFHLPGNVVYRVDFVIFYNDGSVRYVDVKGLETKEFRIKKKLVEALYPIKIEVVK